MVCTPCPGGVAAQRERIVELLQRLVRINSERAEACPGAPVGEGCAAALALVLEECSKRGIATHRLNDMVAWAQVGDRGPLAAFPVHLDVVPAGDGWSRDPYAGEIEDGILYGRGAMDNKISTAILIELLGDLVSQADELPCRLRLIFGTDEESGMGDMRSYLDAGCEQPRWGFVPDASFPVVRGEKARLHLRLTSASSMEGVEIVAGTMANVVPDRAAARVDARQLEHAALDKLEHPGLIVRRGDGSVELSACGRSAHGSCPERGENAAASLLNALDGLLPRTSDVGRAALADLSVLLCRDVHGEALGIAREDALFGPTTVNLGMVRLDSCGMSCELDVRFGRGLDQEEVLDRMLRAFGSAWSVEVLASKPVHLVDQDDPCLKVLLSAYERVTGLPGFCSVMGGGTYASLLPALVAFGPKFPNTHCGAHGIDEHVALEDVARATEVYREALRGIISLADNEKE